MAFLSFDTVTLRSLLNTASTVSTARSTVELYTYCHISVNADGTVVVTAANESTSYRHTLKSNNIEGVTQSISFAIKTDLLSNAIQLTSDTIVGLEIDEHAQTLVIQGSKTKHTLRINNQLASSFVIPADPQNTVTTITLKVGELQALCKQASISLGNPRTVYQPEFLNYCFCVAQDCKLTIATTDRYRVTRLAVDNAKVTTSIDTPTKNYLITPKLIQVIDKLDGDQDITLHLSNEKVVCTLSSGILITANYGEGVFPDYNKIIPASFVSNFTVAMSELSESLKQVNYFARLNAESKSVKFVVNPTDKKIQISSKTQDGYSSEAMLDLIDYAGPMDSWEQSFNVDYLWNFVVSIKDSHLTWEANPGKPSVLSPKNRRDQLLYLVSGLK